MSVFYYVSQLPESLMDDIVTSRHILSAGQLDVQSIAAASVIYPRVMIEMAPARWCIDSGLIPGTPYLSGIPMTRRTADWRSKIREALLRDEPHGLTSHRGCSIRLPQATSSVTGASELDHRLVLDSTDPDPVAGFALFVEIAAADSWDADPVGRTLAPTPSVPRVVGPTSLLGRPTGRCRCSQPAPLFADRFI